MFRRIKNEFKSLTLTIAILVFSVLIILIWLLFRKNNSTSDSLDAFTPKATAETDAEPIISYSLYVIDTKQNKRLEMQSPKEFSNQYGILNGQSIELHWNVLNADWISIDGVGYVQAIGKKAFYPKENTKYSITAKNRFHSIEKDFFVRVFPVPVIEKLLVPLPDISKSQIELFTTAFPGIQKLEQIPFPRLDIPSIIKIQRDHTVVKPKLILPETELMSNYKIEKTERLLNARVNASFKSGLFDKMENLFKANYKIRDIIHTIRKHYE